MQAPAPAAGSYVPPQEHNWRRHLLMIGGTVALLILSFVVGAIINSDGTPQDAPKPVTDAIAEDDSLPGGIRGRSV
jgi:hypothetical protein